MAGVNYATFANWRQKRRKTKTQGQEACSIQQFAPELPKQDAGAPWRVGSAGSAFRPERFWSDLP